MQMSNHQFSTLKKYEQGPFTIGIRQARKLEILDHLLKEL